MVGFLITNLWLLLIFTYLGHALLSFRFQNRVTQILLFFSFYVGLMLSDLIAFTDSLILKSILLILSFVLLFQGKLFIYFLAFFPLPMFFMISILLSTDVVPLSAANVSTAVLSYTVLLVSTFLMMLPIRLQKSIAKQITMMKIPGFLWLHFLFPFSSFLILYSLYISPDSTLKVSVLFLLILVLYLANLFQLYLLHVVVLSLHKEMELTIVAEREQSLSMKYEVLNQQYQNHFNFLHDLLNTYQEFNALLEDQNYQEIQQKLEILYNVAFKEFNALFSNSILLNHLLQERMEILQNDKITVRSIIEYNDFSFLSMNEQTILFTVLLDHAISEIKKADEPRILMFKTRKLHQHMLIQMTYSFQNSQDTADLQQQLSTILDPHHAVMVEQMDATCHVKKILLTFPFICDSFPARNSLI